jgi:hypothetical protein
LEDACRYDRYRYLPHGHFQFLTRGMSMLPGAAEGEQAEKQEHMAPVTMGGAEAALELLDNEEIRATRS